MLRDLNHVRSKSISTFFFGNTPLTLSIFDSENLAISILNVANLKQKHVYLQFQNLAKRFPMSHDPSESSVWAQLKAIIDRKPSSFGFQELSVLFHGIHAYSEQYCDLNNERREEVSIAEAMNSRMARVEAVSRVLDLMMNDCRILEEEQMDCLEECLKLVKKMHGGTEKTARMSTKKVNEHQKVKLVRQQELNIIQKMAQFMLKCVIPQELSIKKTIEIVSTIADQFFVLKLNRQELDRPKEKMKKKEPQLNIVPIEYYLMSGKKVSLVWLLIFRVLQKLMNLIPMSTKGKDGKESLTINEQIDTKVSKTIKEVLYFLMRQNSAYVLLKSLLVCLVQNAKEMELPIVPLFLSNYYEVLIEQFKRDFQLLRSSDSSQQLFSKSIYSLENISTLTLLIKELEMPEFIMEKDTSSEGLCSYCGIQDQKNTYQKIKINLNGGQYLVILVCVRCCKILGFQPGSKMKIDAFAPLIFSRFWNVKYVKTDIDEIRQCLRKVLIYHFDPPQKKQPSFAQIEIAEQIAMNNTEETTSNQLIEGVYRIFLYHHSKLAFKDIIYEAFNVLAIYLNAFDDRIREKAVKLCSQPHLISFVFHQDHTIQNEYMEDAKNLRQKMMAMIELKCRDSDINVRLVALEILLNIYSKAEIDSNDRQEFFKIIFKEIAFSKNAEYITKSIEIIEKSIIAKSSRKKSGQSHSQYFKLILKTFIFSLQCLDSANFAQLVVLKQKIGKLIHNLLKTIHQFCNEDYQEEQTTQLLEELNDFIGENQVPIITSLKEAYNNVIIKMMQEIKIDALIMKNIPYFTADILEHFITGSYSSKEYLTENVKNNLIVLIHIVLEDAVQARDFFKTTKNARNTVRGVFKIQQLQDYLSSSHFLESLVKDLAMQESGGSQKLLNNEKGKQSYLLKRLFLKEILSLSNFCTIINNVCNFHHNFKLLSKNNSKAWKCQYYLSISTFSFVHFQQILNSLLQSIKFCSNQQIRQKGSLIVNTLVATGKSSQLCSLIAIYEKITNGFLNAIIMSINNYQQEKQQSQYGLVLSRFGSITRSLAILTSFITQNEKYLTFNEKITELAEKQAQQAKKKKKSPKQQIEQQSAEKSQCKVSIAFENSYNLIVQVLEIQFLSNQKDLAFISYRMELMLLLNSYWEIHPEIILTSSNFLKQLVKINQPYLIKNLYKLFLSLLPCNDIKILTIINHCFSDSFFSIFQDRTMKDDSEIIEYGLKILQYLLKSGMTRLYNFNKFVYCGLLHPSTIISKTATEIIQQIYQKQASEKLLFANFTESMKFLFDFYQVRSQGTENPSITFSLEQKQALKIIANLTKVHSKCFLAKQKREIRLKTTFTKKLSEAILKQSNRLKQTPHYLMFLAKLLKSLSFFDYCELYQATFSVNKVVTDNNALIQKIREKINDEEMLSEEQVSNNLYICLAYGQLVSCLTYLTNYQQVQSQLKNYNKLLDASVVPYVSLKQDVELTNTSLCRDVHSLFVKIFEDIDIHFDIAIGATEFVPERKLDKQENSNEGTEQAWSGTMQTKPKGKKGGKKKPQKVAEPMRVTRSRKNISHSATKNHQADSNCEFSNHSLKQAVKPNRAMRNLESEESIY